MPRNSLARVVNKEQRALARGQHLVPILIDGALLAGLFLLVPWLGKRIFDQTSFNHVFMVPGFLLMLAGILSVRQLPSYGLDDEKGPSLGGACLVFFQMVIFALLYAYATDLGGTGKNKDGVAVVLFFVFLLPVLGAFYLPVTRAEADTTKALVVNSIAQISVNYLTLLGAAVWYCFTSLSGPEEPRYATGIWFLILYTILYVLFLAFFGLPRLYLLFATGDAIGLVIYLVSIGVFLWNKVPPLN